MIILDLMIKNNLITCDICWIAVHFRYVVFRPFVDEILIGKIKGSSKEGVMGKYFIFK